LAYEYGLVAPREIAALRVAVPTWLEDACNGLTARLRTLLSGLYADLRALDERVRELDQEIRVIGRENEAVGRVQQLRGIGPLIASALRSSVSNGLEAGAHLGQPLHRHQSAVIGDPDHRQRLLPVAVPVKPHRA